MPTLVPVYGRGSAEYHLLPAPLGFETAPTSSQTNYAIGQVVYTPVISPTSFFMYAGAGNWVEFATSSGSILSVNGTANEITSSTSSGVVTLSTPSTFIAPGSIAATTTVTAGTGITSTTGDIVASAGNISTTAGAITSATSLTATSGNITATSGNIVVTAAADGLVFTNAAATAGTTTATLNGRVGQVTITTPSIAAGATVTMTISNTAITGSSTQVGYWLTGGTTGAALTIQSYANTSHQSVVTIQNGTGATTNTASLILNFLVLN